MRPGLFHRTMLDHAKTSIDRIPARERDISALTLCLVEHGLALVKKAIQRFRRELAGAQDAGAGLDAGADGGGRDDDAGDAADADAGS